MEHKNKKNLDLHAVSALGLEGKVILLDIDGTLVVDGAVQVSPETVAVVSLLSQHNTIYLLSNKRTIERNRALAQTLGVILLETPHRKPSVQVINNLPLSHKGNYVVIGDKWLTDGLLAHRIGVPFIKVRRLRAKSDSLTVRLSYLIDDCWGWVCGIMSMHG